MTTEELEIFKRSQADLFNLEKQVFHEQVRIEEIGHLVPGILHINRRQDLNIIHLNQQSCERLGLSVDQIYEMGSRFREERLHPEIKRLVDAQTRNFLQQGDETAVRSTFTYFRWNEREPYVWYWSTSKFCRLENSLMTISVPVQSLGELSVKIERALGDDLFMRKNFGRFQSLTKCEKQILALIAEGYTSKEIAGQLSRSEHTIATHRKNLNAKLETKNFRDIMRYAMAFDLI